MERAYGEIRTRFMTLQLEPGAGVDDLKLSRELGLSRTPVREALFLLASEGLVDVRPGGGFAVRPLDLVDVTELFEAQVVVAKAVARLVANRATEPDLARLREADDAVCAAIDHQDPGGVAAHNAHLHRVEAEIAGNQYLRGLAFRIHDHGQRLGYLAFGGRDEWATLVGHFAKVRSDHAELIDAYAAHDPDRAETVATRHVTLFRDRIRRFMVADDLTDVRLDDVLPMTGSATADSAP